MAGAVCLLSGGGGEKNAINLNFRRSARISWFGAGPPSLARGARQGGAVGTARGVQRRSRTPARTSESLCLWRFFFLDSRRAAEGVDRARGEPLRAEGDPSILFRALVEDRGSRFSGVLRPFWGLLGCPRDRGWIRPEILAQTHPRMGAGVDF